MPGRSGNHSRGSRLIATFVTSYFATLLVILALGALVVLLILAGSLVVQSRGSPRPTATATAEFELQVDTEGHLEDIHVDRDGRACSVLTGAESLRRACVLATYLDPRIIAGEAFGDLNVIDTPSYMAITWRAVYSSDEGFCAAGGLLDSRLTACRAAAKAHVTRAAQGRIGVIIRAARPRSSTRPT